MDQISNYWTKKPLDENQCPNVSLFRFIGSLLGSIKNKKVLEIGFNTGSDLIECKKRGAFVYGTDINPNAVSKINLEDKSKIIVSRCGVENIPFDDNFDLIYIRDTIYYLSDSEILFFFKDAFKKIKENGILIIQFIEKDLLLSQQNVEDDINFKLFQSAKDEPIFPEENPIRFLSSKKLIKAARSANFEIVACKRMIQSYDLKESKFRVDRYLAFKVFNSELS